METTSKKEITRKDFMDFFRDENKLSLLSSDDRVEVFSTILLGSSDFTKEFLDEILSDYGVTDIQVVRAGDSQGRG